jgi:serine/threonine protein phosphatase PrpC
VNFAAKSDRGMVRELNEDSYKIITDCPGVPFIFIIADGMGGHRSGDVASKTAVDFVSNYILQFPEVLSEEKNINEAIRDIVKKANTNIYIKSNKYESNSGMGTTFIIAVVSGNQLYIGHVGDSRVYTIREGNIKRLTTDHSYVEELVQTGSLTREEAENHPDRNIITRALGCSEDIEVDTYTYEMQQDDYIIMCTDGLTNKLSEAEIKEIVENSAELEQACEELIKKANEKGGEDNITVIIIKNDQYFAEGNARCLNGRTSS